MSDPIHFLHADTDLGYTLHLFSSFQELRDWSLDYMRRRWWPKEAMPEALKKPNDRITIDEWDGMWETFREIEGNDSNYYNWGEIHALPTPGNPTTGD